MKFTKLILSFLLYGFFAVSMLFAQQDSMKMSSIPVQGKLENKKAPLRDSTKIDIHPQDASDSSGFYVESKNGESNIRIYASIRLFGAFDFNGLKGGTSFSVNKIPVGSENKNEENFFMTGNLTRFGLESNVKTGVGNVNMKLEADFASEGNHLRLRFAYGRTNFLLGGQAWTVFSDNGSVPNTVDFDGPPTAVLLKSVQIRLFKETKNGWLFKSSIESPNIKISIPDTVSLEPASQVIPDIASSVLKKFKFGHLQFAGILRSVSVRKLSGELGTVTGYGGLFSGRINFSKSISCMYQALLGRGITSFLKLSQENTFDLILNPQSGEYEMLGSYGGFIALTKEFPKINIKASLIFGTVNMMNKDFESGNAFSSGNYISANVFWFSIFGFRMGGEYNYGYSKNKKGESGNANRFAFTFYYDF